MRELVQDIAHWTREDVARHSLALTLFNGFDVTVGGAVVPDHAWRTQKGRSLIKVLALAPAHQLHREQIIDVLWPDLDPVPAINNWRTTLHSARAALEPDRSCGSSSYLVFAHDMLRLEAPDGMWIDVDAFRDAAADCRRAGDPEAYCAAIDLYRGELLPEDCYEDWAAATREALRETWLSLMIELGGIHEASGEWTAGITILERVIAAVPTHEDAHTGLMRLHAHAGRPGQALRQYARLHEAMARELDVEPMPATKQLHADIANGRFGASGWRGDDVRRRNSVATLTNVPVPLDRFVDRGTEISSVKRLLEEHRLVTLTGVGGSGKTRLAVEVARRVVGAGRIDAVWFVELATIREPRSVPGVVAAAIGVSEQRDVPLADTLACALADRSTLLVVDNCEHLVAACAGLADGLLASCPRLRILVTSREALRVAGEITWAVRPLDVPPVLSAPLAEEDIELLGRNEALALLVERIQAVRPPFALTASNAAHLVYICRRLDGLPLAIELAAARTSVLGPEQLAQRLDHAMGLTTQSRRGAPGRQRTMRATLDWSHDLLDPVAQALLRRLAAFAGGWTLDAAEYVGADGHSDGADPKHAIDVLDALTQLIDKSMVQVDEASAEGATGLRYNMLETVRLYAAERLVGSHEADRIRERHVEYFIALADAAEHALTGPDQAAWCARMEREDDNIRAALRWAARRGDPVLESRLCSPLWQYWNDTDRHAEGDRRFRVVMGRAEQADLPPLLRGRLMQGAASLAWVRGDVERAHVLATSALALFRAVGDRHRTAATLHLLGTLCEVTSRNAEARRHFEEALDVRVELGDNVGAAATLRNLGNIARHELDPANAAIFYERSLALNRAGGNVRAVAMTLADLGAVALDLGDFAAAEQHAVDSLLMYEPLRTRSPRAVAMRLLGFAHLRQGRPDRAMIAHQSCLRIAAEVGNERAVILGLEGVASVVASAGNAAGAVVAARLFGAAAAVRDRIDTPLPPCDERLLAVSVAAARVVLGEVGYETALSEGRSMDIDDAIALGLATAWSPSHATEAATTGGRPLTRREREIADLVADGLTNALIAGRLGIARRTVDTHVNNIMRKLGVSSRVEVHAAPCVPADAHTYT